MACGRLYYTLRIATDLPQDIPALDIGQFPSGFEPPSPNVVGDIGAISYTPGQMPFVSGAALPRLEWAIACKLIESEAQQLGALYRWQQSRMAAKLDARLEWIDRFEPTEPEPVGQLTRNIIDPVVTDYGYTYGFPVVSCLISRPTRQLMGSRVAGSSTQAVRLCTFAVGEHR